MKSYYYLAEDNEDDNDEGKDNDRNHQVNETSGNTTLNTVHREFLKLMHVHIFSLYEQTRRIAVGLGKLELSTAALSKPSL